MVIDDEIQIRRYLRTCLGAAGYVVLEAPTGTAGLTLAGRARPDIVILDLGLPDADGLTVLRQLRERSPVPVIVLSVRDSEDDKVALLDAGADDYLTKPFGESELLARLRATRRHFQLENKAPVFETALLKIDLEKRQVWRDGEHLQLTNTEYALLRLFVQNLGRVLTHRQLLREVWGPDFVDDLHYLRAYVRSLRRKLEADPANPTLITTEPGVGYRFAEPAE